jgi:soluble lytic murein transglycosylase
MLGMFSNLTRQFYIGIIMKSLLLFILLLISSTATAIETWQVSTKTLTETNLALLHANNKNWPSAEYYASRAEDRDVKDLVFWLKCQQLNRDCSFGAINSFIQSHGNWPGIDKLVKSAEYAIDDTITDNTLRNWFTKFSPTTSCGFKAFARLYPSSANIKKAWHNADFSSIEQRTFYKQFTTHITKEDNFIRAGNMINKGQLSQAEAMLNLVNHDHKSLLSARIKLAKRVINLSQATAQVPETMRHNSGLIYDKIMWYHEYGNDQMAISLLLNHPSVMHINPDKLWKIRVKYIRELIDSKRYKNAYLLAKHSHNLSNTNYVEAEWLSGWIAEMFLHDHNTAIIHFKNLYNKAEYPLSKSRAAYWLSKANSNIDQAQEKEWHKRAESYPYTFYGQLAIGKADQNNILAKEPVITESDRIKYRTNKLARIAYIVTRCGRKGLATKFLKQATKNANSTGEVVLITQFGMHMNSPELSVDVGKEALRKGIYTNQAYYKISNSNAHKDIEFAFTLAIIRQESLFNKKAISTAGATGMMQIMPRVAKQLARELRIPYVPSKLSGDVSYNVKLGNYYLSKLLKRYDGSYILAIAAYNAGEGNVDKWIIKYGDPRKFKSIKEVLKWLELIPFYETRNYVQRVIENIQIYRHILYKEKLNIVDDLIYS